MYKKMNRFWLSGGARLSIDFTRSIGGVRSCFIRNTWMIGDINVVITPFTFKNVENLHFQPREARLLLGFSRKIGRSETSLLEMFG